MEPNTINLILFIEGLAAIIVKSLADLKDTANANSLKAADQILDDADKNYRTLLTKLKMPYPTVPEDNPATSVDPRPSNE